MAVNRAKQRMLEGKPAIGGEVGLGSPLSAELISPLGFDFVLVDNQHGFWFIGNFYHTATEKYDSLVKTRFEEVPAL